ncbi:Uma2 family endonuclease [Leptolyngbya sp. FACHB-16]|uniref:Uma2 family endonuclease n=1 Tax=unclassified Leptolyngbya TaxID=2650499 RepID=UPI0016878CC6|nr:Uma2 family endonuclease [Leptolyngbya sp. FACHB-16]MBD2157691.1 Uma2 family endonuclease [Leptolyngbya sp. FACHB-16]
MVNLSSEKPLSSQPALAEKRVSLRVSWDGYEAILEALGGDRSAQLTYYEGTLEIMTPLEAHENSSDLIGDFIKILVEETNLTIKSMGSTTLKRLGLQAGAEPDRGFYIANEPKVRGKTVDLNTDPPPDLVVEVDITHTDIDKNALYAELGIPEFWRYDGKTLTIYQLQNGQYQEVPSSPTFSWVPKRVFYEFLQNCAQQGETQAKRSLRQWIRENLI